MKDLRSAHDNSVLNEVKVQFTYEVVGICSDIIPVRISVGPIWEEGGRGGGVGGEGIGCGWGVEGV